VTKENLSHWQALIRFVDDSVVAYFFGPPCMFAVYFAFSFKLLARCA